MTLAILTMDEAAAELRVSRRTRELSTTPAAIRARERRFLARVDKEEAKFHGEVKALMVAKGLSFDDAWVAAGGLIVKDRL